MSYFKAKMHLIQFLLCGNLQRSPDPLAGYKGLLLRGGSEGGKGKGEGKERERVRERGWGKVEGEEKGERGEGEDGERVERVGREGREGFPWFLLTSPPRYEILHKTLIGETQDLRHIILVARQYADSGIDLPFLSVCLTVCLSVCPSRYGIVSKRMHRQNF